MSTKSIIHDMNSSYVTQTTTEEYDKVEVNKKLENSDHTFKVIQILSAAGKQSAVENIMSYVTQKNQLHIFPYCFSKSQRKYISIWMSNVFYNCNCMD